MEEPSGFNWSARVLLMEAGCPLLEPPCNDPKLLYYVTKTLSRIVFY